MIYFIQKVVKALKIKQIKIKVRQQKFYYTVHAIEKAIERDIVEEEVVEALKGGEIIEDYPKAIPFPSCLIFGRTKKGRPLHIVASTKPEIWIVTVYEPDPREWTDFKFRKR